MSIDSAKVSRCILRRLRAQSVSFFPRSAHGQFLTCGQDLGNEKLVVVPDGSAVDIVGPDLFGSECISLPEARFIELTQLLTPASDRQHGLAVIEGNTAQMNALRQTIITLVAQAEPVPNAEQLSSLLAATVLYIADSVRQGARAEILLDPGTRRRIAKQAQAYIDEHYRQAIRMEDLCRLTGIGVRTLQRSFRQYFDFTISDYVKTVRLNAAQRELTAAHPAEHSVTEIAVRNGFTHLGRFSTEFRERFGHSPKETLAKRANQKS